MGDKAGFARPIHIRCTCVHMSVERMDVIVYMYITSNGYVTNSTVMNIVCLKLDGFWQVVITLL